MRGPGKRDWDRLVRWYRKNARRLPWRKSRDPYPVLVSEFMLQQTRVETVLAYYEPFLARFPDLRTLARARVGTVLAAWSGLGYYRRARFLHEAAGRIVREHGGQVPDDPEALRALPGIGDYTAAAVLSIAFGRPEPVLDGNVARVLARYRAVPGDPKRGRTRNRLRELAAAVLAGRNPGETNQALMELGAAVCLPGRPDCRGCPLSGGCEARRRGRTDSYPARAKRLRTVEILRAVAVIRRGARVLLVRRRGKSRLDGFLEFPGVDVPRGQRAPVRLARHLARTHGLAVVVEEEMGEVRHQITHHQITARAYSARARAPVRTAGTDLAWVDPRDLDGLPIPAQTRKVARLVAGEPG
ncbi:MAG: A/G-specific adenine glycosylase [Planctomycetes bacterium]|nr:A/G-specific adenine glycosylase [Planctomycetota bacterium]